MITNEQTNGVPTLYVVDPERERRDDLRAVVRELDCRVREFSSAEALLAELDGDTKGCIVVDWQRSGGGELELLKRLHEDHAHLPVIVMAGEGNVPAAVSAMRAGAATIVETPYAHGVLRRAIRRLLPS